MIEKSILTVKLDEVIGTINPNIYGHFIEHQGRCIYPGIWVGYHSKIPNVNGLRKDVVEALKRIKAPVIRWPGGCFADVYHWEDGIGPIDQRPRCPSLSWGRPPCLGEESNEFGTDEFMMFCKSVGAEPYLCINVGSGSPEEARSWLEYCNYAGSSRYAKLRAKNGHPKPFGVKYWGVGNESWGCGGLFDPTYYAWEYRRFANFLKGADPSIQLIACGHTSRDWNFKFMENLRDDFGYWIDLIDHLSIHYYFRHNSFGGDVEFTDEQYFNLLLDVQNLEYQIQQTINIVDFFSEKRKNIGIVVDEWGVWHPQATCKSELYQQNTLRDAILAAVVLNLFNKYSDKVVMANIAQAVNLLQSLCLTKGEKTVLTPTYYVYDLYKSHMGSKALKVEIQSPIIKIHSPRGGLERKLKPLQALDASASLREDGNLVITLVNQSLKEDLETEIRLVGARVCSEEVFEEVELVILNAEDVREYNDFNAPNKVIPKEDTLKIKGRILKYVVPKHSISRLVLMLKRH